MNFRKFLCGTLATLMLATSCINASAANTITNNGDFGTTRVTYGMGESFLVTIPADFTIDDSNMAEANVSATEVMISHGSILKVSISGGDYINKWELIDTVESDNRLEYTIGTTVGGHDIVNNSVVLSVNAGEAFDSTKSETMYFTVVDTLTKAGLYVDAVTFTAGLSGSSLVEGDGQVYNPSTPSTLSFRADQPISEFQNVYVNDELVDPSNYELVEGSTIIIFDEDFLDGLTSGNYTVTFEFKNTTITATFSVIVNDTVDEITFRLDNNTFKAQEGMTWAEWVDSKYNTSSEYGILDNTLVRLVDNNSGMIVESSNKTEQYSDTVIVSNENYKQGLWILEI